MSAGVRLVSMPGRRRLRSGEVLLPTGGLFVALNVVGGVAVLASYAYGVIAHPETRGAVWGGVPGALRPLYTVSMLLAALGYFPMTGYVLLRLARAPVRVGPLGFGVFHALYAGILLPSALWMPLTFAMLEQPSPELWGAIRAVLGLVAVSSLGVAACLVAARPRDRGSFWRLALAGCVLFCNQTVFLDAVVWPHFWGRV